MGFRTALCAAGMAALLGLLPGGFAGIGTLRSAVAHQLGQTGEEGHYPPYLRAWESGAAQINPQAVRDQIARLRSDDLAQRAQAIAALDAVAGDRFGYAPDGAPEARRKAIARWEQYAQDLEKAVREWAPSLTQVPSLRNRAERGHAAYGMGVNAPHAAFLPLLREVVANRNDNYADNGVRIKAIKSISMIRHEGVMDYLIEHLDTDLGFWVRQQLLKLTIQQQVSAEEQQGGKWYGLLNQRQPGEDWPAYKKRYQEWWARNKATFVYKRDNVMMEIN